MMRHKKKLVLFAVFLICTLGAVPLITQSQTGAVSGSQWRADRIIDDSIFYDGNSMTVSEIQNFLNSKVPVCDTNGSDEYGSTGMTRAEWADANNRPEPPYICLKDYSAKIPARAADQYCDGSINSSDIKKSAAYIIYTVSKACNINPKVLIVTLQKEQTLVTDDWPWPIQYTKAMGFGCPDSDLGSDVDANNNGCYDAYEGFFKQVYYAARQFQRYKIDSEFFNYAAQQRSFIAYNPSGSCSGTNVTIFNHATAGLYNYTPYQPNAAALSNLYGSGNACSAYGNRNFWRMYSDWFGNTLIDTAKDKAIVGDWDGDGIATPAIKRGNTYFFDNDNDGEADTTYSWGKPTDKVFVGKWNGVNDGIALKRGQEYFLDYNNNGTSDKYLSWGKATDTVIVGDWYGSPGSNEKLGLKRGKQYFLDWDNNGSSNVSYAWGKDTDQVIVGDWYGSPDNKDGLGLKRGNQYFLDYDNNGSSNVSYSWGKATDIVMVGKWGLGKDALGLKRGNQYFLDYDNNASSNKSYAWGKETDAVIYGSWDTDIADELGLKRASNFFLDYGNNASSDLSFVYTY